MSAKSSINVFKSPLTFFVSGLMLIFLLAACGASSSSTGSGSPPTTVKGYGTAYGCPSDAVVSNPRTPNVTINPSQSNTTVNAQVGNLIEIRLPFGSKWTGPTNSSGNLQLLTPAGFANKSAQVCVWQFTAQSAGTTHLTFQKAALCKAGEMCAQYIMNLPFTIDVH